MLRNLFQVKNECIPIENFNINGDVRSIQRLSLVIMIHCREIVRRNYNYFKTVTLTLCDASAKPLSVHLVQPASAHRELSRLP